MRISLVMAFASFVLLALTAMPNVSAAQDTAQGIQRPFVLGPPGCVRVWMYRSRQTRYAGAPRCRRIYL